MIEEHFDRDMKNSKASPDYSITTYKYSKSEKCTKQSAMPKSFN